MFPECPRVVERVAARLMTLIGTLVNGTFSGGPHTAAANRPPGTSNPRSLVRARTRFGKTSRPTDRGQRRRHVAAKQGPRGPFPGTGSCAGPTLWLLHYPG